MSDCSDHFEELTDALDALTAKRALQDQPVERQGTQSFDQSSSLRGPSCEVVAPFTQSDQRSESPSEAATGSESVSSGTPEEALQTESVERQPPPTLP